MRPGLGYWQYHENFSIIGFVVMALCIAAAAWLAPVLDKRGRHWWALILRFIGFGGGILCWIIMLGNK